MRVHQIRTPSRIGESAPEKKHFLMVVSDATKSIYNLSSGTKISVLQRLFFLFLCIESLSPYDSFADFQFSVIRRFVRLAEGLNGCNLRYIFRISDTQR